MDRSRHRHSQLSIPFPPRYFPGREVHGIQCDKSCLVYRSVCTWPTCQIVQNIWWMAGLRLGPLPEFPIEEATAHSKSRSTKIGMSSSDPSTTNELFCIDLFLLLRTEWAGRTLSSSAHFSEITRDKRVEHLSSVKRPSQSLKQIWEDSNYYLLPFSIRRLFSCCVLNRNGRYDDESIYWQI